MPKETKLYSVLIASPGDVSEEREIVRQEVYRWNSMHATEMGVQPTYMQNRTRCKLT